MRSELRYFRISFISSLDTIADGMAVAGRSLSHFTASFGSDEVLSSDIGRLMRLGSSFDSPSAAATPLRSARRASQVWALAVAS